MGMISTVWTGHLELCSEVKVERKMSTILLFVDCNTWWNHRLEEISVTLVPQTLSARGSKGGWSCTSNLPVSGTAVWKQEEGWIIPVVLKPSCLLFDSVGISTSLPCSCEIRLFCAHLVLRAQAYLFLPHVSQVDHCCVSERMVPCLLLLLVSLPPQCCTGAEDFDVCSSAASLQLLQSSLSFIWTVPLQSGGWLADFWKVYWTLSLPTIDAKNKVWSSCMS